MPVPLAGPPLRSVAVKRGSAERWVCVLKGKIRMLIESVDKEIAFYRKRAGQVFFIALPLEVLIVAGEGLVNYPG